MCASGRTPGSPSRFPIRRYFFPSAAWLGTFEPQRPQNVRVTPGDE